jgi:site-specific recombinase XerC
MLVQKLLQQQTAGEDISIPKAVGNYVESNVEQAVKKILDFVVSSDHPYSRRQLQIGELIKDGAIELSEYTGIKVDKKYEVDQLIELIKLDIGKRVEEWILRYGVDTVEPDGRAFWSGKRPRLGEEQ